MTIPVDYTYHNVPMIHWYRTKTHSIPEEYMSLYRSGKKYVGFLDEPSYELIERYDLRYEGYGGMDWVSER